LQVQQQTIASPPDRLRTSSGERSRFPIVLWLVLGALPLAVAPGVFVAFDLTPKLLVLGAAACLSLVWISDWYPGLSQLAHSRWGRLYLGAVALQAVSLIASSLSSGHTGLSLAGTTWRRYGLATQLMILLVGLACGAYFARRPEQVSNGLTPLLVAGAAAAIFGIAQYFHYDFLIDPKLYSMDYLNVVRPPSTLGHAMYFSAFLLPVLFIAAARGLEPGLAWARVMWLTLILISIVAIVLSGTRSSMLGLLAGGLVFAFRSRHRWSRRHALLASAALVIFGLALAVFSFTGAGESFRGRIAQWNEDSLGGPRLLIWRECLGLFQRHPVLGGGPETFAQQFRTVESASLARAYPEHYLESPHNLLLETGLAQGAVGLLALILLIGASLMSGFASAPLSSGLLSGLIATLAALQFMPFSVANALCVYCFCAILVSMSATRSGVVRNASRSTGQWTRTLAILATPAVLLVAVLFAVQDWAFARAGDAIHRGDLAAAASYRGLSRLRFPQPGQDLWLSRQFATTAVSNRDQAPLALRLAAESSEWAERSSEEPFNAYYQSAALALAVGDSIRGEEKLRAALRLAPEWYKPHVLLAESLIIRGCTEQGTAQARQAADLAGVRHDEIESTIRRLKNLASSNPQTCR